MLHYKKIRGDREGSLFWHLTKNKYMFLKTVSVSGKLGDAASIVILNVQVASLFAQMVIVWS